MSKTIYDLCWSTNSKFGTFKVQLNDKNIESFSVKHTEKGPDLLLYTYNEKDVNSENRQIASDNNWVNGHEFKKPIFVSKILARELENKQSNMYRGNDSDSDNYRENDGDSYHDRANNSDGDHSTGNNSDSDHAFLLSI